MPWEDRDGKGRYFTVTFRLGGRAKRFYLGKAGSLPAELAAVTVGIRAMDFELRRRSRGVQATPLTDGQEAGIEASFRWFQDAVWVPPSHPHGRSEEEEACDDFEAEEPGISPGPANPA